MADNSIPKNNKKLITLGGDAVVGLNKLGVALKITQLTPAELSTALSGFIVCEGAYSSLRGLRNGIYETFHTAESAMSDWLDAVRNVLRTRLGARYSNEWLVAGFTNNTTQLPRTIADRLALTQLVIQFLGNHPTYQIADLEVTPARGLAVYTAANSAYSAVGDNDVALKQKDDERTTARTSLVDLLTTLIYVLRGTLTKDDPRWLEFGLEIPAISSTPAAPTNLRVSRTEADTIALECDATSLGKTFRWRMRTVDGLNVGDYTLLGRTSDPTYVIPDSANGLTQEFIVQAVNGSRQSVASASVVLLPSVLLKSMAKEATPATAPASNGHGARNPVSNGNGLHSRAA